MIACSRGDIYNVRRIITLDTEEKCCYYQAVTAASEYGNLEILKLVFPRTLVFTAEAVRKASEYGHLDVVKYLFDEGEIGPKDDDYKPLVAACRGGHVDVIKYFVSIGADVTEFGPKAVAAACDKNRLNVIKYLAEIGAYIFYDFGPIRDSAMYGHLELIKYLVSIGADIWLIRSLGNDPAVFEYFDNLIRTKKKRILMLLLLNNARVIGKDLVVMILNRNKS